MTEDLQQRFAELEAQLEHHASKAKYLRDQGLPELAEREDERWKAVSREYVAVGDQIVDQLVKSSPQPADFTNYEDVCSGCCGC